MMWKLCNILFGWDYCMISNGITYTCRVYTNQKTDKRTTRTPWDVYDVDNEETKGIVFPLTYKPRYLKFP